MSDDDYERRMQNWRRWRLGGGSLASTGGSPLAYERMASGIYERFEARNREAKVPLLEGEAMDTDRAVRALERALRAAVETMYLAKGSLHAKARSCGCRREGLLMRLDLARVRILDHVQHQREQRLRAQAIGERAASEMSATTRAELSLPSRFAVAAHD